MNHGRKWQFQYDTSTCFSNDFPELDVSENNTDAGNEVHSVAPGEGKQPTNILS